MDRRSRWIFLTFLLLTVLIAVWAVNHRARHRPNPPTKATIAESLDLASFDPLEATASRVDWRTCETPTPKEKNVIEQFLRRFRAVSESADVQATRQLCINDRVFADLIRVSNHNADKVDDDLVKKRVASIWSVYGFDRRVWRVDRQRNVSSGVMGNPERDAEFYAVTGEKPIGVVVGPVGEKICVLFIDSASR